MLRCVFALLLALAAMPAAAQDEHANESLHRGGDAATPPAAQNLASDATADIGERIFKFDSDIAVARNGTLTVTETIAVHATGDRIKHGIYRDFPTDYTDGRGAQVRVRFDVVSVTMDGHDETYDTESISNGVRVKIGDKDELVDVGDHTYVLSYITARQIGFFDTYDELYWNVTGNGWIFPIEQATATIHLPKSAKITRWAFYTGMQGADGKLATAQKLSDDTIHFATTNALDASEGLTVAVDFAKGAVTPPSAAELRREYIIDNASGIVAVLGLLALAVFYLTAWWHYGRDPKRGTIIPLFDAPAGLSPEAVRYIHRMTYDRKAFAAALINMAVKGFLTIADNAGTFTLTRTGKSSAACGLSASESAMADAMFLGETDALELKQANHTYVQKAISALQSSLKAECEKHYFVTNSGWFWGGLAILVLTGVACALLSNTSNNNGFLLGVAAAFTALTSYLLHHAWMNWVNVFASYGSRGSKIFFAVVMTLLAIPCAGLLIFAVIGFGLSMSTWPLAALIVAGVLAYTFYYLLRAPTASGAVVLDQIDGFKLFLETAEKDRLEILHPPNVTPALFEKFLPYAIALDCENSWSKKFEAQAAAAGLGADQHYGYVPLWYAGNNFNALGTSGFASSLGASLGSAAASASTAPGSSSGGGGGGFSGGGGGGGGGGGW